MPPDCCRCGWLRWRWCRRPSHARCKVVLPHTTSTRWGRHRDKGAVCRPFGGAPSSQAAGCWRRLGGSCMADGGCFAQRKRPRCVRSPPLRPPPSWCPTPALSRSPTPTPALSRSPTRALSRSPTPALSRSPSLCEKGRSAECLRKMRPQSSLRLVCQDLQNLQDSDSQDVLADGSPSRSYAGPSGWPTVASLPRPVTCAGGGVKGSGPRLVGPRLVGPKLVGPKMAGIKKQNGPAA